VPLCALILVAAPPAVAQEDPPGRPLARSIVERPDEDYVPPTMTFPDNRISLIEAVRLTLLHEPNIKLAQETVLLRRGIAQIERGAFDPLLTGTASYELLQEELTSAEKSAEQERRDAALQEAENATQLRSEIEQAVIDLENLQRDPEGYLVSDPGLRSRVAFLNTLINSQTDPVLRQALIDARSQQIADELEDQRARLADARADEENAITAFENLGAIPDVKQSHIGALSFEYLRPFRNGILFGPFVRAGYDAFQFRGKRKQSEFGGTGVEDSYRFDVGFTIDVPLMRGSGEESVAAFERATNIDYQASIDALTHSASAAVLNTLVAYWNLVAAQEQVDIANRTLVLQTQLVETSRALIEGDELPRAELSRVLASQSTFNAQVLTAESNLAQARVRLARAIGLNVESEANAPLAADSFPVPPAEELVDAMEPEEIVDEAVDLRFDHRSAVQLAESGRVLWRAAELDLRPILDLNGELSYNAVGETTIGDAVDKWVGPSFRVGALFERPMGNNAAEGRLLQANASYSQRRIQAGDLARTIRGNVVGTLRALQETVEQMGRAQSAVDYYRATIDTEYEKFRLGSSTLIDTIVTQEQQTSALLSLLSARQSYATLLAQLRFETATLVEETDTGWNVAPEDLVTVPFLPSTPAR
jgi:outer membrane protein TolC